MPNFALIDQIIAEIWLTNLKQRKQHTDKPAASSCCQYSRWELVSTSRQRTDASLRRMSSCRSMSALQPRAICIYKRTHTQHSFPLIIMPVYAEWSWEFCMWQAELPAKPTILTDKNIPDVDLWLLPGAEEL